MTLRLIFGLGWSLVAGLAGAWLVMAPWALREQGGGGWSIVTRNEFGAGVGLIVLAAAGVAVVAAQTVTSLREAGVIAPPRAARREAAGGSSPEMEQALIALAQALAEDLDAQRAPGTGPRTTPPSGAASWRQQP